MGEDYKLIDYVRVPREDDDFVHQMYVVLQLEIGNTFFD